MSYTFRFEGKAEVRLQPAAVDVSGQYKPRADYLEQILLKNRLVDVVNLISDVATVVSFGGLASACVVSLRVITPSAGKVLAALTHADGVAQSIPIDPLQFIISLASPFTAITLTRSAGVAASVEVMLGELST